MHRLVAARGRLHLRLPHARICLDEEFVLLRARLLVLPHSLLQGGVPLDDVLQLRAEVLIVSLELLDGAGFLLLALLAEVVEALAEALPVILDAIEAALQLAHGVLELLPIHIGQLPLHLLALALLCHGPLFAACGTSRS